jgi:hypothetical protein
MNKHLLLYIFLAFSQVISAQDSAQAAKVPFDGYDLTWVNGQNRQHYFPLELKDKHGETILTAMALGDVYYNFNFARPIDNTQTNSASIGRSKEVTLNLFTLGMETDYKNIIGRVSLQIGNIISVIQDLDQSVTRGRNTSIDDLRFIREAAVGYHFNKLYGINIEGGIFMSYIGLESYLLQENWCYQRSMVCEFTPFYFTGARMQIYPSKKVKTEIWLVNGWQSYNSWNKFLGLGNSTYWRPNENLQFAANFYAGEETKVNGLVRFHHDNSICYRYYQEHRRYGITQAAFSINNHFGFQAGTGVSGLSEYMLGTSVANRVWFASNKYALTARFDIVSYPGIYLAFSPSPVTPNAFTDAIAADPHHLLLMEQAVLCFDIMPLDYFTFRIEYGFRHANVPYFAGHGGTTSPDGFTTTPIGNWKPDLIQNENRITISANFRILFAPKAGG